MAVWKVLSLLFGLYLRLLTVQSKLISLEPVSNDLYRGNTVWSSHRVRDKMSIFKVDIKSTMFMGFKLDSVNESIYGEVGLVRSSQLRLYGHCVRKGEKVDVEMLKHGGGATTKENNVTYQPPKQNEVHKIYVEHMPKNQSWDDPMIFSRNTMTPDFKTAELAYTRCKLENIVEIDVTDFLKEAIESRAKRFNLRIWTDSWKLDGFFIASLYNKNEDVRPELRVETKCESDEQTCLSGDCLRRTQICDFRPDCPDRDDEQKCSQSCDFDTEYCTWVVKGGLQRVTKDNTDYGSPYGLQKPENMTEVNGGNVTISQNGHVDLESSNDIQALKK
ncbi:uncharacterized protein LOC141898109 [Tubulanus polymorphus]|uniref:uncharacterized protein LOC141898109 n=1 Tax=Tubulanus polymorphus TaxID=672921 RepID=UPI003DA481D0